MKVIHVLYLRDGCILYLIEIYLKDDVFSVYIPFYVLL